MKFNNKNVDYVDDEFGGILFRMMNFIKRYKILVFFLVLFLFILIGVNLLNDESEHSIDKEVFLSLVGEKMITIYQGDVYVEPGYEAYDSEGENLEYLVEVNSNLDSSLIGEYQITYVLGDIVLTRTIIVSEVSKERIYLELKPINNDIDVYLLVGEKYNEPGYVAYSSSGQQLTDSVLVTGNVDVFTEGTYPLIYSVVGENGVLISAKRLVVVTDIYIKLSLSDVGYTNNDITLNIEVSSEYFDYMILPDGNRVETSTYDYNIVANGTYMVKVYNVNGGYKRASIDVVNIDRTMPVGSCMVRQDKNNVFIDIDAYDANGIKQYVFNNNIYVETRIPLLSYPKNARVTILDVAGNSSDIVCTIDSYVFIDSISVDGVILSVEAKTINNEIAGYYFSYNQELPDKNNGGYVETSANNIDVVRLPGSTYVWVEDVYGRISEYKKVVIDSDALLITNGKDYTILQNVLLSDFLKVQGWSLEEFNRLIARSVRAAGIYTKESAATAAIALQTVLAQKYQIKLPYWWGGKSWNYGAQSDWGKYRVFTNDTGIYQYYGMDCSGFISWSYVNAGYDIKNTSGYSKYPNFWDWDTVTFSSSNGEIGDFLVKTGHIKLIIAKTEDGFITAESKGNDYGMVVNIHKYAKANGYKIVSAENLMSRYSMASNKNIPMGT